MTFNDKIDNILKYNKLNLDSIYKLELYLKLGQGAISKKYKAKTEPTVKIQKTIIDGLNINPDWWERGEGEIFKDPTDIAQHPLVIGYVKQLAIYEDHIKILKEEIERLKNLSGE